MLVKTSIFNILYMENAIIHVGHVKLLNERHRFFLDVWALSNHFLPSDFCHFVWISKLLTVLLSLESAEKKNECEYTVKPRLRKVFTGHFLKVL